MKTNFKIWRFLLRSTYAILVKIWKWLKLLKSLPFIKKTIVNHAYNRISSSWLTFTVLQWMKTDFKISKFSRFLLRSDYVIHVNSFPFIKKTLLNHPYIPIWSFWLTFTALQSMKANFKISQFEDFCQSPDMRFWSIFEND